MNIGIDGNEANVTKRVGVNVYAYELIWALSKLIQKTGHDHHLIVYLKDKPLPDMPPESERLKYRVISGRGMWIITRLMPDLYKNSRICDVFFTPSHYVPPLSPMPRVCSVMDLGYLETSEQFKKYDYWQLRLWTAISIYISKSIIAISNATAKDIVRHYPSASKKIIITHLAYDHTRFHTNIPQSDVRRIKKRYSIVTDYVLFLSTLKPSKNIEGLLDAWKIVTQKMPNTTLVIAGKKGWLYETIFSKVKDLNIQSSVVFTDFIEEQDKPALISGAKIFVLPSFWEGFGLDPLNAMACGVPVVVSNRGSLPEVVGNAGVLVDPEKPQAIGQEIIKILRMNKKSYNMLVQRGLKQANLFTWENTALKTLEILESTK